MRRWRPAIAAAVLAAASLTAAGPEAQAAKVAPAVSPAAAAPGTTVKARAVLCQVRLDGPIEEGDADRLTAALDALGDQEGRGVRLCLNSPGGNYDEALKLIEVVLKRTDIGTVIDRGAECYSACAFLFLSGNTQTSEDGELGPDRTLDVRGTLGFHAPYLTVATGNDVTEATIENFRRGVGAIAKLLEIDKRSLFPRGLLARALQVGPDELLYVDTIEKAGVWSIGLKGYRQPAALSSRMIDQACRSKDLWTNFSHSVLGRPADDFETLHGVRQSDFPEIRGTDAPVKLAGGKHRETLDLFGFEATNFCVADVYQDAQKRLFLSLQMVPTDRQEPVPDQSEQIESAAGVDPQTLALLTTPLWYVYPPETLLKSIALPETKIVKKPPQAAAPSPPPP